MKLNQESRENWRDEKSLLEQSVEKLSEVEKFAFGALFGGILTGIAGYLLVHWENSSLTQIVEDFYTNISTELVSIFFTVFIIERLLQRRADKQERERLLLQMGHPKSVDIAIDAVRQLRARGWLIDGRIEKASLQGAQLEGVDLNKAKLIRADFFGAVLIRASFLDADLKGSKFVTANLSGAKMYGCNMTHVDLTLSNLRGAELGLANLSNARLGGAHLEGAILEGSNLSGIWDISKAFFDESTVLPDGAKWTTATDVTRFTNPNHVEFWQPNFDEPIRSSK